MIEQHPLLCEDLSEEERPGPFHRRLHMGRARARNNVKGAAAIIVRWPEQWTSLLTYWWSGVAMIVLSTFLIYNFLFSYATFQSKEPFSTKSFYIEPVTKVRTLNPTTKGSHKPKVFMHIILDDRQQFDLNAYLPYIELITNKYTQYQYEIIVIANDTNVDVIPLDDEKNDEQALNTILTGDFKYHELPPSLGDSRIKYTTLSHFLDDSPLNKYWKYLPHHFISFLVRAISIWEHGGIAFDPVLLTPKSPHSLYIDKINNILTKFNLRKRKIPEKHSKIHKTTHKVNNIRDIINALSSESEDHTDKSYHDSLMEAETKLNSTILRKLHGMLTADAIKINNQTYKSNVINSDKTQKLVSKESTLHSSESQNRVSNNKKEMHNNTSPESRLLSLFMNYLFHNEQTKSPVKNDATTKTFPKTFRTTIDTTDGKDTVTNEMEEYGSTHSLRDYQKPVIISAKGIYETTSTVEPINEEENLFEVTIDLKGKIVATDTACHAFIGSMFSNAIHHDQSETVTDFILKELSIFCKGLLASCVGIDVILL